MGLMAFNETNSQLTGSLILDICSKFGLIVKDENGKWMASPDADAKRADVFGDVKIVDNIDKVVRDVANRPLSLKESSDLATVFSSCLDKLMVIPGDWHARLSMLQSINNIFWDGFLHPFVFALK